MMVTGTHCFFVSLISMVACYGSSLTFVVDTAQSMAEERSQIRDGLDAILDIAINRNISQIENMILVTFSYYPDLPQLIINTTSRSEFKRAFDNIQTKKGDVCQEMVLSGVELALESSLPGSYIYVFTDASARDEQRVVQIKRLCQKKQSQVVYMLTGWCTNPDNKAQSKVHYDIATACSGLAFKMERNEVVQGLRLIQETLKTNSWYSTEVTQAGVRTEVSFCTEESSDTALIAVSGRNVIVNTKNLRGDKETIMSTAHGKVVKLFKPSGVCHSIITNGTTATNVIITGTSAVYFRHGFSEVEPKSLDDTLPYPILGTPTYLSVLLTDTKLILNQQALAIDIWDMNGKHILRMSLNLVSSNFYTTNSFRTPSHTFRIELVGDIKSGHNILIRKAMMAITPQEASSNQLPVATACLPTATSIRGAAVACAGQTIFEENFNTLREDVWRVEQYIPKHAPFPFVSYQRLATDPTVYVDNGILHIAPRLQQNLPGYNETFISSGTLDLLSGCTMSADDCVKRSWGADILPPIVSGKISSYAFAFKYGIIYVRAKMPQGDWLYPEMLLEPFLKKYGGHHYASGVVNIAAARGNLILSSGTTDYSNKVLYGGPIMDLQCHTELSRTRVLDHGLWGDEFHEYAVRWAPDGITLSADGVEWARITPPTGGLRALLPASCAQVPHALLARGSTMAPFDDYFYISLGVASGGVTQFPDAIQSRGDHPKPWANSSRKALLNFWRDLPAWFATWSQPQLLVDYIKVVAL